MSKRIRIIINEHNKIVSGFTYMLSQFNPFIQFKNGKFVTETPTVESCIAVERQGTNLREIDSECTDELYSAWLNSASKEVFLFPDGSNYRVEYR